MFSVYFFKNNFKSPPPPPPHPCPSPGGAPQFCWCSLHLQLSNQVLFLYLQHCKIYVDMYLKLFRCILVLIHIRFNNIIIRNVPYSFLSHIRYEKQKQYLAKGSVSSKYRVEPESKKSNVNDILS